MESVAECSMGWEEGVITLEFKSVVGEIRDLALALDLVWGILNTLLL